MAPNARQIRDVQHAVQHVSFGPVHSALQQLQLNHLPANRWLSDRNRYARDTVARLNTDAQRRRVRRNEISQYIAASAILHCFDGWSFLSHAARSMLQGDEGTAIHLAYYAELRAAMSFLACEGIGVFVYKHIWLDVNGRCNILDGPGTHDLVWLALEEWSTVTSNASRLLSIFSTAGNTFDQWLNAAHSSLGGTPSAAILARHWLTTWSLDLKVLGEDHFLRNSASYRPQGLTPIGLRPDICETLDAFIEYWLACEPAGAELFQLLDYHLLRQALRSTFQNRSGSRPRGSRYTAFIDTILGNLGLPTRGRFRTFLIASTSAARHPLLMAAQRGQRSISVFARALLLLRLASAAVADMLASNAIRSSDLAFWWGRRGDDIGLWDPTLPPGQSTDLWVDIRDAIQNIQTWCDAQVRPAGVRLVMQDIDFDAWHLAQFQRAGLWGMGL
jgi:hypothetical protein